jgi:hypothetical protein
MGIEPTNDFYATDDAVSTSVICPKCRVGRALRSGHTKWLYLTSVDSELTRAALAWENNSQTIRNAVLALTNTGCNVTRSLAHSLFLG